MKQYFVCKYTDFYDGGKQIIYATEERDNIPVSAKDLKTIHANTARGVINIYKQQTKQP